MDAQFIMMGPEHSSSTESKSCTELEHCKSQGVHKGTTPDYTTFGQCTRSKNCCRSICLTSQEDPLSQWASEGQNSMDPAEALRDKMTYRHHNTMEITEVTGI